MKEINRRWVGFKIRHSILESSWLVTYDLEPSDEGYSPDYIRTRSLIEVKYVDVRTTTRPKLTWAHMAVFNMISQGWATLAEFFEPEDRPDLID